MPHFCCLTPCAIEGKKIDRLWSRLGPGAFVLADHWVSDLGAVGIAGPHDPGVVVYLTCYGEPPGRFGYELELPPPPGDDVPYQVAGTGADLPFEDLVGVVAGHLKRAEPGAAADSGGG